MIVMPTWLAMRLRLRPQFATVSPNLAMAFQERDL